MILCLFPIRFSTYFVCVCSSAFSHRDVKEKTFQWPILPQGWLHFWGKGEKICLWDKWTTTFLSFHFAISATYQRSFSVVIWLMWELLIENFLSCFFFFFSGSIYCQINKSQDQLKNRSVQNYSITLQSFAAIFSILKAEQNQSLHLSCLFNTFTPHKDLLKAYIFWARSHWSI